jgi:hypothetical protein
MIQRSVFFSCLLTIISLFALGFFLFFPTSSDKEEYEKILEKRKRSLSTGGLPLEAIHQMRDDVQKDIWTMNEKERLHFRIVSEHSDLSLHRTGKSITVSENLQNIRCWIQEKILPAENQQIIRFFYAQEGLYQYPSHSFSSPHLFLSFFQIPGQDLPDDIFSYSPYLQGLADQVSFQFTEKIPGFEASRLRALYKLNKELMP